MFLGVMLLWRSSVVKDMRAKVMIGMFVSSLSRYEIMCYRRHGALAARGQAGVSVYGRLRQERP